MFPLLALIQLVLVLSKEQLTPADLITDGIRGGTQFNTEAQLRLLYLKHQYKTGCAAQS